MNIVILANRDLASNYALNLLLPHLSQHSVSLFLSAKVGGNSSKPAELVTLSFFEQTLLNQLLSPLFEKLPSHKGFMSFAQMNRILVQPVEELNAINSPNKNKCFTARINIIYSLWLYFKARHIELTPPWCIEFTLGFVA